MQSPDPNAEGPDDELSTQPTGLAEHAAPLNLPSTTGSAQLEWRASKAPLT